MRVDIGKRVNVFHRHLLINLVHGPADQPKFGNRADIGDKPASDVPPLVDNFGRRPTIFSDVGIISVN